MDLARSGSWFAAGALACAAFAGCRAAAADASPAELAAEGDAAASAAPVELEAAEGWIAQSALDLGETGIWTVAVLDVFGEFGGNEIVALDDLGRCHVLVRYATRWTDLQACSDGTWLGGLARADLDPLHAKAELYVGGRTGSVYQVVAQPEGVLDARLIAHLAGQEVHTLVQASGALLAFTSPGALWRLEPEPGAARFRARELGPTFGRVRDACVLGDGRIATVSRAGELALFSSAAPEAPAEVVLAVSGGLGRVAAGPGGVLYAAGDDGVVWRAEHDGEAWQSERIYAGPPGLRGIAVGHFSEPAPEEQLALFGYSAKVELLARSGGVWSARTVFEDRDKGHWLARGELDPRNSTDELVGAGYGGRVFVLARAPGYGLAGVARPDAP